MSGKSVAADTLVVRGRPTKRLPLIAAAALISLAACASGPSQEQVGKFAEAVGGTTMGVRSSFKAVEDAHASREYDQIAASYLGNRPVDLRVSALLPQDVMAPRLAILEALDGYAELLASVAGDQPYNNLQTELTALGTTLTEFRLEGPGGGEFQLAEHLPPETRGLLLTAVNSFGTFLIDRQIRRRLPPIIEEQHTNVRGVATLLIADIGGDAEEPGCTRNTADVLDGAKPICKMGLLSLLDRAHRERRTARDNVIRRLVGTHAAQSPEARVATLQQLRQEMDTVRAMDAEVASSRAMLLATQRALRTMVRAHDSLRFVGRTERARELAAIRTFYAHARRIRDFYVSASGAEEGDH